MSSGLINFSPFEYIMHSYTALFIIMLRASARPWAAQRPPFPRDLPTPAADARGAEGWRAFEGFRDGTKASRAGQWRRRPDSPRERTKRLEARTDINKQRYTAVSQSMSQPSTPPLPPCGKGDISADFGRCCVCYSVIRYYCERYKLTASMNKSI